MCYMKRTKRKIQRPKNPPEVQKTGADKISEQKTTADKKEKSVADAKKPVKK